ncbi:sulfatase [Brevifollis gellanilyticus]|uniref:Iduronate-2-sulfatase n=1 Tax=Brevifollis gellanilyticus TaxID=748831 RepID=A0A512MH81_9BACT|nr:sulfatase [Brevifollis gellanilyticus]GEP46076.1 iduronate-2-sulfatase [Brevifollis gellanilyticus]
MRALFFLLAFSSLLSAAEKPNVLLVCVDDLKPVIGCYGDAQAKTPNIDRLAARGMLFEKAYCNQAVCSPSRNALLTSLRPQTLGIYELSTNFRKGAPDAITLPQLFKNNGYRTEGMGKIFHVGHGNVNDDASWSVPYFTPKSGTYVLPENGAPPEAQAEKKTNPKVEAWKLARGAPTESADVSDNRYGDGMVADEAVKRLDAAKQKPDEPFFLAVGFVKPHLPFVAPKKYWDLYDPAKLPQPELSKAPEGAPEFAPTTWGELRNYKDMPDKGPVTPEQQRHLIHGYYAAMSYMDAQLGKVLDALDASGLAKNTIIVFWGDHGWHLGDHGMWCKHTNYEQAAHIPLLISAPGVTQAGARTQSLTETVDIYPTLAELAGLKAPETLDGRSFASVLKDGSASNRDHVIHVYPRGENLGRAIRTQRHRLVEWKPAGGSAEQAVYELYDYQADPLESKNLAAEQPAVVTELKALLAKHPEAKLQISNKPEGKKAGGTASKKKSKSKQDRHAMFDSRDTNKDGQLTMEEFLLKQPDPEEAPKRFPVFDADKNGVLSREEFVKSGKVK